MPVIDDEVYADQLHIQLRTEGRYPQNIHENHKERALQLIVEGVEVLNLAEWKPHRHDRAKGIDRAELMDELADVYKFWLNLLIIHGITPQMFEEAYLRKHQVVLDRLRQEGL